MACALYVGVRKYYPVPYEWGRIAKLASDRGDLSSRSAGWSMPDRSTISGLGFLLVLFLVLLFVLRFFTSGRIAAPCGGRPDPQNDGFSGGFSVHWGEQYDDDSNKTMGDMKSRFDANNPMQVGGQAVIEGVMMRAPGRIATAVRQVGRIHCHARRKPTTALSSGTGC